MGGVLLNDWAVQAIVVEGLAAEQSGEFYLSIFGDCIVSSDNSHEQAQTLVLWYLELAPTPQRVAAMPPALHETAP